MTVTMGRGVLVRAALVALVGCAARGAPATGLPTTAPLGEGIVELTRTGGMLEVRTTEPRGLVHVYVRAGDRLHVLHASASIGSAEYRRAGGAWQRVHDFQWSCRAPEPAACHAAFFERERWDATPVPPGQRGAPRRFRVDLGALARGGGVDVAVARYVHPGEIASWPATVRDDARNEELLRGMAPPTLSLDLSGWAHLPGDAE